MTYEQYLKGDEPRQGEFEADFEGAKYHLRCRGFCPKHYQEDCIEDWPRCQYGRDMEDRR